MDLSRARWTLHLPDASVPATVPGCVHTDLLTAGRIPDPYEGDNESLLTWIGRTDVAYEAEFDWTPGAGRTDLVCDGLDTVAAIELNGVPLGETANMHRRYRFEATAALRPGPNRLVVRFTAPYTYAERQRDELGDRPGAYPEPYQFIRKMACNFGWDWGPTLVTSGIWRPIRLESWSAARLAQVRPVVDATGRVVVHAEVERANDQPLTLTAQAGGARASGPAGEPLELQVPEPRLWWPRGYGSPELYELEVELSAGGETCDTWRGRIGFRDVALDTTDGGYTLVVNGRPVFARGVNWIPDDCFPARMDRDRYARRLGQACDAGVNLVRVWGGGIYEDDSFYDLCDELGLLVWQDFPFACAAYPEEGPFRAEVEAEARDNITRLAPHPSLVVWCGNNENVVGFSSWGWQEKLAGRSWGAGFYYDLLPRLVAELDPARPYWPASPYSGDPEHDPDDPDRGTSHLWEVWNSRDYTSYRDSVPRFAAEFGFQAPPAYATGGFEHQKATDGDAKLRRWLEEHFGRPATFDDWLYLTQVNQARALTLGIEHLRSWWPVCAGTVIWQLNDCWPVTSWSAVDGAGRRKPLWYALRRIYADRLLTIQPRDEGPALVAVNDSDEPWRTRAVAALRDFGGKILESTELDLEVPARGVRTVPLSAAPAEPLRSVLTVTAPEHRCLWFFARDKELDYPAPAYTGKVSECPEGLRVSITAVTLLRDLALFPDRLDPDATVDDMLVTLLPGETAEFTVTTRLALDQEALLAPPVLRSVGDS